MKGETINLNEEGQAVLRTILNRKSTEEFIPDHPVPNEVIHELVKAGMAAPSAKNQQPWVFLMITDPNILYKLSLLLPNGKMLSQAGGAIMVCGDMTNTLVGPGGDFWIQDCAAASQNILLAAEAFGLGSVWIGIYPNRYVGVENVMKMNKLLNLPGNIIALNIIALGSPAANEAPKDKYDETKIFQNTWK